jgi:predicted CXXCH cytochrome family protein
VDESLVLAEKAASGELCLGCHKDIDLDIDLTKPKEEKKAGAKIYKVMHKPFKKRECVKCHETHASKYEGLKRAEGQQLCYKCHKSKELDEMGNAMFSVHQPINNGKCLGCHFPHGSKNNRLLREPLEDICFICHDNFLYKIPEITRAKAAMAARKPTKKELEKLSKYKIIHKPITEKGCVICHNPHSSKDKKLLVSEGDKFFCYKCHNDFTVNPEFEIKSVHKPVSDEDCIACHEMHATDNEKLLKTNEIKLCNEKCHKVSPEHHEFNKNNLIKFKEVPESFTTLGNSVLCTNCHNPHSSKEIYLFTDIKKNLCLLCHTTVPSL